MDWEPTCQLRRYDDTPKLTNPRLQQLWQKREGAATVVQEWRDVPLIWDGGHGTSASDIDPTAGLDPNFNWGGDR